MTETFILKVKTSKIICEVVMNRKFDQIMFREIKIKSITLRVIDILRSEERRGG